MDTQLTKQPATNTAALHFTPPPDTISEILGMLGDADTLLSDIAEKFHTTLEALTLWMAQDDIIQRMAALQSAIAARVRLIATAALPKATEALTLMIGEYTHEAQHVPTNHGSLKAIQTRHRSRDLTRKAISLLHRLTKFAIVSPVVHSLTVPPDVRSSGQPVRSTSQHGAPAVVEAPTSGGTSLDNRALQVIDKARMSCFNSGKRPEDHFVDVTGMVEIGKGGHHSKSSSPRPPAAAILASAPSLSIP